jgi:hypothetical protein
MSDYHESFKVCRTGVIKYFGGELFLRATYFYQCEIVNFELMSPMCINDHRRSAALTT